MKCEIKNQGRASLRKDERGLSTVEYALLFVLIVAGTAGLWSTLGTNLVNGLTDANGKYGAHVK